MTAPKKLKEMWDELWVRGDYMEIVRRSGGKLTYASIKQAMFSGSGTDDCIGAIANFYEEVKKDRYAKKKNLNKLMRQYT